MLYDSYHKKISKIVGTLRKIFKHIVLISIVLVLIIAAIVAFMATKGIVLDDDSVTDGFEMTYGDGLPLSCKALFAKVVYEYSDDGVEWNTIEPNAVGEYKVRAAAKNIFGQYRYGNVYSFKVLPKQTEVLVSNKSVTYGELPLVFAELAFDDTVSCDAVEYSDRQASITMVTPVESAIKILNANGDDVTHMYELTVKSTEITILPRTLEVTVSDKEMIYNDTKLSYDGYEISDGELAEGDILQAVFDKYLIDVGSVENTPTLSVITHDGLDVSLHYEILTQIGSLTVDYRPLIIETGSAEKVYDDTELSNTNYEITGEYDIVDGHTAICVSNSVLVDVDEVENVLALEIKNASGEDKTENYSLFYERGTLKVTPRPVKISSEDGEWVYDGLEHYTDISMEGFCAGHTVKASWPSIIDAGEKKNEVVVNSVLGTDGRDVISNYELTYDYIGTLKVTKRPITITNESSIEGNIYNGMAKRFEKYQITDGSLATTDNLMIEFPAFSKAGTYDNVSISATVISNRVLEGQNSSTIVTKNINDNYEVTEIAGKVIIVKCKLTIKVADNIKEYDGDELSPAQYSIVEGVLPAGHTLNVVYKDSGADVGEYDADIDLEKTTVFYLGSNATENFDLTVNSGKLIINPRRLVIRADDAKKTYDGTPLTASTFTFVDTTLANENSIVLNCIGSQTEIGTSDNVIDKSSIVITNASGADVTKNYQIECQNGILEVVVRKLAVTANSKVKYYNGIALVGESVTVDEISDENDGLLPNHSIVYELSGSITMVGTVSNVIKSIDVIDQSGESVKKYYQITTTNGILEILPLTINITTESDEQVYNGLPLTCDKYTSDHESVLAEGDSIEIEVDGTITDVGTAENTVKVVITDKNGNEITDTGCYKIVVSYGSLTVTPRIIKIKPLPDKTEKLYDGTPLECLNYEDCSDYEKGEGLIEGHEISHIYFASLTDAGTLDISILNYNIYGGKVSVKNNYTLVLSENVTLTVTKRKIVIQSASAKKEFDGNPLTAPECMWSDESLNTLVDGHVIEPFAFGSQTVEGVSSNTMSTDAIILDRQGNNCAKNYDITYREGTLKVYKTVVARIISTKGGYIYLKAKSYGDYNGKGFDVAPSANRSFNYNGKRTSFSVLSSMYLESVCSENTLTVSDATKYLLPYYMAIDDSYVMPEYNSEDYTALSNSSAYTVPYYDYCFENGSSDDFGRTTISDRTYRVWARTEYTQIPEATKVALLKHIEAYGFKQMAQNDPEKAIKEIALYVRLFAQHNEEHNGIIELADDIAVAFFNQPNVSTSAKHYAIAATMLYRAVGISARFVEGYVVNAKANSLTEVKNLHYWVEVYLDGYGWMQVEVTTGFGNVSSEKTDITLKPMDKTKIYDGKPLTADNVQLVNASEKIVELFEKYTIEATFSGSITNVYDEASGQIFSKISSVKILDEDGYDITYKFNINTNNGGDLTIEPATIDVCLKTISKNYDGKPLSYSGNDFYSIRTQSFKDSGAVLKLNVTFTDPTVRSISIDEMNANISQYVTFTIDGSSLKAQNYKIKIVPYSTDEAFVNLPIAQINKRVIELTTATETKYYIEGAVLQNNAVEVTRGSLVSGHMLYAEAIGVLDKIGSTPNVIDVNTIKILDENGNDVTGQYQISVITGILTFLE